MAAKTIKQSKNANQEITVWISENEITDDESSITDSLPNSLKKIIKEVVRSYNSQASTKKSSKITKPSTLPRWKRSESVADLKELREKVKEELHLNGSDDKSKEEEGVETLSWTHNFKTFSGKPLPFTNTSGPTIDSTDPLTIFTRFWDRKIMTLIVEETNRYAKQTAELQKNQDMPENHVPITWNDTTIEEMYVLFALIIFASYRATEDYLFGSKSLKLPVFSEIMSLDRFVALNRFLHFVDNEKLPGTNNKIAKMKPILDHCNEKFSSLYKPRQFLDVDDSFLLLKKGCEKSQRLQANHFGIRTYELSEVFTGYVLKVLQYPGNDDDITSKDKAQIVLDLVSEYSNKGHRVVTSNYFSSVYLARKLKSKGFDMIGEVRNSRKDLPEIIQQLKDDENDPELYKLNGNSIRVVTRHCGDISVVAWSEWDIITLSTYHTSEMKANKRGVRRPAVTLDYHKVKEKISEKDEDLSDYVMIRQPAERWYIRQFKSLFNISLRNMYIIYKSNSRNNQCCNQVSFRYKLANQLLDYFGVRDLVERARAMSLAEDSDDESSISTSDLDSDDSSDCCIM